MITTPAPLRGIIGPAPEVGPYTRVDCADAPNHLKTMFLLPWALNGAKPGDHVVLTYSKTGGGYQWLVTEVLS